MGGETVPVAPGTPTRSLHRLVPPVLPAHPHEPGHGSHPRLPWQNKKIVVKPCWKVAGWVLYRAELQGSCTPRRCWRPPRTSPGTVAQKFVPEIKDGDKRIPPPFHRWQPVPYACAGASAGRIRGNSASAAGGAAWHSRNATAGSAHKWRRRNSRGRASCSWGLDDRRLAHGDQRHEPHLTAGNWDTLYGLDIAGQFMDMLAKKR